MSLDDKLELLDNSIKDGLEEIDNLTAQIGLRLKDDTTWKDVYDLIQVLYGQAKRVNSSLVCYKKAAGIKGWQEEVKNEKTYADYMASVLCRNSES